MKKLILGLCITMGSPFIILLGSVILNHIAYHEYAFNFACVLGGASIIFNWGIGIALIIKGHQEIKSFENW